jgi:hypothetical protein
MNRPHVNNTITGETKKALDDLTKAYDMVRQRRAYVPISELASSYQRLGHNQPYDAIRKLIFDFYRTFPMRVKIDQQRGTQDYVVKIVKG